MVQLSKTSAFPFLQLEPEMTPFHPANDKRPRGLWPSMLEGPQVQSVFMRQLLHQRRPLTSEQEREIHLLLGHCIGGSFVTGLASYCNSYTFKLDAKLSSPELNLASLVAQTVKNLPAV